MKPAHSTMFLWLSASYQRQSVVGMLITSDCYWIQMEQHGWIILPLDRNNGIGCWINQFPSVKKWHTFKIISLNNVLPVYAYWSKVSTQQKWISYFAGTLIRILFIYNVTWTFYLIKVLFKRINEEYYGNWLDVTHKSFLNWRQGLDSSVLTTTDLDLCFLYFPIAWMVHYKDTLSSFANFFFSHRTIMHPSIHPSKKWPNSI